MYLCAKKILFWGDKQIIFILFLCFIILSVFNMHNINFQTFLFEVINYYINTPTSFAIDFLFSHSVRLDKNQKLINYVVAFIAKQNLFYHEWTPESISFLCSHLKLDNRFYFLFISKYLTQLSNSK